MLVNGGKRITPTLVDRIQDRDGRTVYRHDDRTCLDCRDVAWQDQPPPRLPDTRAQIVDPATAYQIVAMLQGVIDRGTAISVRAWEPRMTRPLAGKTGTTQDLRDAWFVGFTPDLVVGVYVGFDQPRTMGPSPAEQASHIALPVWKKFMLEALKDKPVVPFRIPPGIRLVRVDAQTGRLAASGGKNVVWEAFKPGTEPGAQPAMSELEADAPQHPIPARTIPTLPGGGIY